MKKYFWCLVFFGILFHIFPTQAENNCKYQSQIDTCKSSTNPLEITEFVCPTENQNDAKVVPQVILDIEFQKIDREVEMYIDFLEKNKDVYFWPRAQKTYPEAIDDIVSKFEMEWYFGKRYTQWCLTNNPEKPSILWESLKCLWWVANIQNISSFFNQTTCTQLVATKLDIYRDVSFQVLKLNKSQIQKDTYTTVMQDQRGKYDRLIDMINLNLSFIERIWARVPYFVKDTY